MPGATQVHHTGCYIQPKLSCVSISIVTLLSVPHRPLCLIADVVVATNSVVNEDIFKQNVAFSALPFCLFLYLPRTITEGSWTDLIS